MEFFQSQPELPDPLTTDAVLQEYMARKLPDELRTAEQERYAELSEESVRLYHQSILERTKEPVHTAWDAWGQRVDELVVSPLWHRAEELSVRHGLVAAAYGRAYGPLSRVHQFIMNYLIQPSMDVYSCPLAMTDGAASTLLASGNKKLVEHAVPHLTSADPKHAWTSGQWMTERTGGSDVGTSETVAEEHDGKWSLTGTKWFTSATTSQMALTLARPVGNEKGSRGLALFYVELRDAEGKLQNIRIHRLKDKLGTRKVPTAELSLERTPATLVAGRDHGVKHIAPILTITRTWNTMAAVWSMRRCVALAHDYATRRRAFGADLIELPLHRDTLAGLTAEAEAAFHMGFFLVELLGKGECGEATQEEAELLRLLTPIAKLTTAKQAVAVASESLECFGGAGYVEDTGLPRLLADAQVLPIWEGTTNVLALDAVRAISKSEGMAAWGNAIDALVADAPDELRRAAALAQASFATAKDWLRGSVSNETASAGYRRFALTLGRSLQLALLVRHAGWCATSDRGGRAAAAARRFAAHGVLQLGNMRDADANLLCGRG